MSKYNFVTPILLEKRRFNTLTDLNEWQQFNFLWTAWCRLPSSNVGNMKCRFKRFPRFAHNDIELQESREPISPTDKKKIWTKCRRNLRTARYWERDGHTQQALFARLYTNFISTYFFSLVTNFSFVTPCVKRDINRNIKVKTRSEENITFNTSPLCVCENASATDTQHRVRALLLGSPEACGNI